jgi:hypothetical protein
LLKPGKLLSALGFLDLDGGLGAGVATFPGGVFQLFGNKTITFNIGDAVFIELVDFGTNFRTEAISATGGAIDDGFDPFL